MAWKPTTLPGKRIKETGSTTGENNFIDPDESYFQSKLFLRIHPHRRLVKIVLMLHCSFDSSRQIVA